MRPSTKQAGKGGFSLVEMATALGIVSFAFVSLFSLLPLGMKTFHGATDRSIGTWISQQVVGDVQQSDFDTIVSSSDPQPVRYFDVDGGEVKSSGEGPGAGVIYHVNVRILPSVTLPGASEGNANLAVVTVQIANNPGNLPLALNSENLWTATPGISFTTYTSFVSGSLVRNFAAN